MPFPGAQTMSGPSVTAPRIRAVSPESASTSAGLINWGPDTCLEQS
jgi:hypothetical protein